MRVRTAVISVVSALLVVNAAHAEDKPVGVVTAVEGSVTLRRASLPEGTPLQFKEQVKTRDRIVTGEEARARLLLGGKATVTVRERSVLTISEDAHTSLVEVASGAASVAVVKAKMGPNDRVLIVTPNAIAGIRGTVVVAEVSGEKDAVHTRISVLRGVVEVVGVDRMGKSVGSAVMLHPMQATTIAGPTAPAPPLAITPVDASGLSAQFTLRAQPRATATEWIKTEEVIRTNTLFSADAPSTTTATPSGSVAPVTLDSATDTVTKTLTGTTTPIQDSTTLVKIPTTTIAPTTTPIALPTTPITTPTTPVISTTPVAPSTTLLSPKLLKK